MKIFIVYATGEHGRPYNPKNPTPQCFTFKVQAASRKEAINKVAAEHRDFAVAHQFCKWEAYLEEA